MFSGKAFTRRNFIQTAGIASVASLAHPLNANATEKEDKPLPPAIAALTSMRDQAKPITKQERQQRLDKAKKLMAENKLDAVMMAGGTSLVYFSNIRWWLSERFFAMVLPLKGEPFYVCPAFEEERAREQISSGPLGDNADVRTWQEDDDPYARVVQGLKDRGIAG